MILSLVTGTLDRPESFKRLVDSIARHTTVSWELVVSDASTVLYNLSLPPAEIVWLPERPRLGMIAAYNRAFRACRGQWVIWLNDDAEVQPGYANAAIEFMEGHPEIGLGALYYTENKLPYRVFSYAKMIYANFGIIRRELGNQVGWFDEELKMYGCDNSQTFRVLLAEKGIASIPGSRIWHHAHYDKSRLENQALQSVDSAKLWEKYGKQIPKMRDVYRRTAHLSGPEVLTA